MKAPETHAPVEYQTRPSYAGMYGVFQHAYRNYYRRQGKSEESINFRMRNAADPKPQQFPGDVEFPMDSLKDDGLGFFLTHTSEANPYYRLLEREVLRRQSNGDNTQLSWEVLNPPRDLLAQIAYKSNSKVK